jgi:hypothetical protein
LHSSPSCWPLSLLDALSVSLFIVEVEVEMEVVTAKTDWSHENKVHNACETDTIIVFFSVWCLCVCAIIAVKSHKKRAIVQITLKRGSLN